MKKMILFVIVVAFISACKMPQNESGKTWEYRVEGSAAAADVTIATRSGTSQFNGVTIPWYYGFDIAPDDGFLYVSAQNTGSSGAITVKIQDVGTVIAETSSSGAYCIATANYSLH